MRLRQITKYRLTSLTFGLLLAVFSVVLPPAHLHAANPENAGNVSVSPAIINLTLPPGQQDATTNVTVTNNYTKSIHLSAEWQSIDEATGRLIPSGPLDPVLTESLRVSETDIQIAPQSSKRLTVAVHNTPALAPGGHYAVLVFTVVAQGKEKLGLQSALSVTVFIVKRDGARTEIKLNNVSTGHGIFRLPQNGSVTFTNTGNVHVVPRAAITIERKGEVVAKAIVNEASSPLLPGKKAVYEVSFKKFKNVYWPSHLQLHTVYRVDQSGDIHERLTSFWYIPPFWPLLVIGLSAGLYFGIKKGWPVAKRIYQRAKRGAKKRKSAPSTTQAPDQPQASKINVSSVEISPSHTVPVERGKSTEEIAEATKTESKKTTSKKRTNKKK